MAKIINVSSVPNYSNYKTALIFKRFHKHDSHLCLFAVFNLTKGDTYPHFIASNILMNIIFLLFANLAGIFLVDYHLNVLYAVEVSEYQDYLLSIYLQ